MLDKLPLKISSYPTNAWPFQFKYTIKNVDLTEHKRTIV